MGGIGSGAQPHWHGLAWNWLVHGRKEWLLWPPQEATYALRHVLLSADAAANATVPPLRCTQLAGEVLIVPQLWGHATVNSEPALGFATEMDFDKLFDLGLSPRHGNEWWRTYSEPAGTPESPARNGAPGRGQPSAGKRKRKRRAVSR